jgi:hypothetical protein
LGPVGSRFDALGAGDEEHRHLNGAGDSPERCLELGVVFLEACYARRVIPKAGSEPCRKRRASRRQRCLDDFVMQ